MSSRTRQPYGRRCRRRSSPPDIGNVGRPGFVALAGPQSFNLDGAGYGANGTDAFYYVHQPLAGDGEMIVRMTTLQKFDGTRAGIMIRESLTTTARYVSLLARPSEIARVPGGSRAPREGSGRGKAKEPSRAWTRSNPTG